MPTAKYTIIYDTGQSRHKLLKLMLTDDGSYYATCPYHRSDRVDLIKRVVNYSHPNRRPAENPLELAVVEDDEHRLKLSHHPDGFVQFSGHGIRSGRNEDGSPKGMGLKSWPLSRPTAGPAFGLSVMNPAAFKEAGTLNKSDIVYAKDHLFMATEDNGLIVETYYFAPLWRRFVKMRNDVPIILIRHPSGALLEMRVCPPPNNSWNTGFLGVDVWPAPVSLGSEDSGFAMSSPTGNIRYNEEGELEAEALFAHYPPNINPSLTPMLLAFPVRDDPSYRQGERGPTEDALTSLVKAAPQALRKPQAPQDQQAQRESAPKEASLWRRMSLRVRKPSE